MLRVIYLIAGVVAFGATVAGPALAYFEVVEGIAGFGIMAFGMLLGTVVAVIGVGVAVKGGSAMTYTAALLGVPPLLVLVGGLVMGGKYPAINDISTETVYPPPFKKAHELVEGEDFAFPSENAAIIEEAYPDLGPVAIEGDAADIVLRASELARQQAGWTVSHSEVGEKESFIEGYATSTVFKFVDDWVIRVTTTENGAVVDMRSRSRDGQGDLGANAKRIRAFLEVLKPGGSG